MNFFELKRTKMLCPHYQHNLIIHNTNNMQENYLHPTEPMNNNQKYFSLTDHQLAEKLILIFFTEGKRRNKYDFVNIVITFI